MNNKSDLDEKFSKDLERYKLIKHQWGRSLSVLSEYASQIQKVIYNGFDTNVINAKKFKINYPCEDYENCISELVTWELSPSITSLSESLLEIAWYSRNS